MASLPDYQMPDLSGRFAIVTGGTKGIGAAAARLLAQSGAEVLLAARDAEAGRSLSENINKQLKREAMTFAYLDLADLGSVREFVSGLKNGAVDLLINNAGVMEGSLRRTKDGFEWNLGINFLAHFLLSELLVEHLAKGREPRVVQLASGSHRLTSFDFEDPNFDRGPFDGNLAYPRSKIACSLFAVAFSKHFAHRGIEAFSVSPGIVHTDLLRGYGNLQTDQMMRTLAPIVRTAEQAALCIGYAASAPELRGLGGTYIEDCAPAKKGTGDAPGGVMQHAIDPDLAERLWEFAEASIKKRR